MQYYCVLIPEKSNLLYNNDYLIKISLNTSTWKKRYYALIPEETQIKIFKKFISQQYKTEYQRIVIEKKLYVTYSMPQNDSDDIEKSDYSITINSYIDESCKSNRSEKINQILHSNNELEKYLHECLTLIPEYSHLAYKILKIYFIDESIKRIKSSDENLEKEFDVTYPSKFLFSIEVYYN